MKLSGKVALITGAASGIGKETALHFAKEGASVVACDINDQGGAETVLQIEQAGGRALYVHSDVAKARDCKNMIEKAESTFGGLHILFNNAGIMDSRDDDAELTEEEVWDLTMNINLKGVFLGCKYGIPALKRAGGGSIIEPDTHGADFLVDDRQRFFFRQRDDPGVGAVQQVRSQVDVEFLSLAQDVPDRG